MHPGLHPIGMAVVGPGNCESDMSYGAHRPYPGQGLRRLPGHSRVVNIQQQSHQRLSGRGNIREGSKITTGAGTPRPRIRQSLVQGRLQPTHSVRHMQTVS